MKKSLLFTFSLLMALVMLACQPRWQSSGDRLLKPGEEIDGMVITTGAAKAPLLWAFCSPALEDGGILTVDCHVPLLSKLAIGLPFDGTYPALQASDWSALMWEMHLDGHPVDLEAFGVYTYVVPDLAPSPSPIREVFRQKKAWDVAIVNPSSGMHTLRGLAHTGTETFTWVVNFTVKAAPAQ